MKRAGVFLKAGLMLVVVAFVAWTAWDLGKRWQDAPAVAPHVGWLLLSCVPIGLVSLVQALGWQSLIVRMAGRPLPAWLSMELFLASMLGRYAPAKVGMAAVLISRAKQLKLSAALMGSAMLLIVLVYAILGAGMGLGTLSLTEGAVMPPQLEALRDGLGWLALVGMAAAVVVLLVVDRRRYPAIVLRLLKLEGEGPLVGPGVVFWYGTVWVFWWIHGVLLVRAVGGTWAEGIEGAGLFVIAPVIGFLALVAPGGLGVREAVVAAGLEGSIGPGPAVVAALVSRFVSLGADLFMWLGFRAVVQRRGMLREDAEPTESG